MMYYAAFALSALVSVSANPQLPQNPPAVFGGYTHAVLNADACNVSGPGQTICILPPKTMGRYLITAAGTSTANGPDATQVIAIAGPGWACSQPVSTKKGQWTTPGPRILIARCVITVLSDDPVKIVVSFGGADSKLAADGPKVILQPVPWNGILETSDFQVGLGMSKSTN